MATPSTLSSTTALQGISTGIQTDALIQAILAQKGVAVTRMQARKDLNDQKTTALTSLRTSLNALALSMASLQDKFNGRTVTSSDATNAHVTAVGTGALAGNYDVRVDTVATKGRLSATLDAQGLATNLAVADPSNAAQDPVFDTGSTATFAIQGTDGVVRTFTLTEATNSLNGLRDAINASGVGVTAQVVNTGKGPRPYQLVVSAKDTGTGVTAGRVTLADITQATSGGQAGAAVNALGITAGAVNDPVAPTAILGGLGSDVSGANATDARFTLNGIALVRDTNVVKDAVDGMTFTLKQGAQTDTTTLTVATDKTGLTTALQDFITKYNALLAAYRTASTSTKNSDGSINQAPLAGDASTRALMGDLKARLVGASAGLPSASPYQSWASLGVTTQADGTLYLNTNSFQTAVTNDPDAAQRLFSFTGASTSGAVAFKGADATTATGVVEVQITRAQDGTLWGTLGHGGKTSDPIPVVNGTLSGTGDLAGLSLAVTGVGVGTVTLSRGAGQAAKDLLSAYTTAGTGALATALQSIQTQNKALAVQIANGQSRLDREKTVLQKKFADMEAVVGQMKAAAGSLVGA